MMLYLRMSSSGEGGCSKRLLTVEALDRKIETMFRIFSPKTCSLSGPIMEELVEGSTLLSQNKDEVSTWMEGSGLLVPVDDIMDDLRLIKLAQV